MQKIEINLSTRKRRKRSPGFSIALILLFVSLIWSLYSLDVFMKNRETLLRLERSSANLEQKLGAEGHGIPSAGDGGEGLEVLKRNVDFINGVITRRAFSWTGLLDDLEDHVPPDVSIVRITPDFTAGTIKITGLAKEMRAVLSFVERMAGSPDFKEVFLLKHSEKKPGEGEGVVLFDASAIYSAGDNL